MRIHRFHCPRRDEVGATPGGPNWLYRSDAPQDRWIRGHGTIYQLRGCSYCGSMNPDDFMQLVRDGAEIGPSTKNYKVYVTLRNGGPGKFYFRHLSEEQRREFFDLYRTNQLNFETVNLGKGNVHTTTFDPLPYFIRRGGQP